MKNACIYARFSSHSQNEQSIEGQLRTCYDFAERHGYNVISEYIDRAISGTTDNRPEFQRMIEDSAKRRFDIIIVYQLDRFARNRYDSATNKAKLKKNGVKVISARENITDDASGILMEAVLEGMAEYYSAELAQKIRRGMDINAEKKLSNGSNPGLGFRVTPDKHIVVDEANAPHIVRVYEMYANGATMLEIVNYLNSVGAKTSHGKPFSKNSLQTILRNKRYVGIYSYKGVDTPDALPRIVPQHLFDQVQKRLIENVGAGGRGKSVEDFILSGKLFCGHCLIPMTGTSGTSKTGKLHSYYKEKGNGCKSLTVIKWKIEGKVIEVVRDMLTEENQMIIAREISTLSEHEQDNPNLKRLQKLLKEISKQKTNLLESLKVGKASATAANYVFNEIDRLERETADLEQQVAIEEDRHFGLSEVDIMYFLSHLKNGNLNEMEYRKLLVNTMVNSVYVYTDDDGGHKLTIVFNVSNQPPVKVDAPLLDEIQENAGSYASLLSPPKRNPRNRNGYGDLSCIINRLQYFNMISACFYTIKYLHTKCLNLHTDLHTKNRIICPASSGFQNNCQSHQYIEFLFP